MSEDISWHEKYRDPLIGGLLVGQTGSMKRILDEETEKPITKGFHDFWMHKGTLMGSLGAKDSPVTHDAHDFYREKDPMPKPPPQYPNGEYIEDV